MMMSDLPANVRAVKDRHGKTRYRFRRKGWASAYLPGSPATADFHRAYADLIAAGPAERTTACPRKFADKSLDHLFAVVKQTAKWQRKGQRTRHVESRIIERFLDRRGTSGRRYGERPVAAVSVLWLETIFGQMHETPAAANILRKILKGMLDLAVSSGWITANPARYTTSYPEGAGYHTWTDAEIDQYRSAHPLGTMARLVLELALNTAARRCNVAAITRDDMKGGRIVVAHAKGNDETSVPILPETQAALDALPAAPIRHLVTTSFGKPFTDAGLGNRMRKWCAAAGLPHCSMHGLRKATSRRLAESGATDAEGQAVTGHKKAATFQKYRAKANRVVLADRAMSNLQFRADVQPTKNDK